MKTRSWTILLLALLALDQAGTAQAGMPMVTLTDVARMRLQTLSFFLLCLLGCAWVVQRIWNSLAKEFPRLPRLDYRKALGLLTLWGLLFVLILTMISGARELMTPGAWKKVGYTYKLDEDKPPATAPVPREAERRQTLDRLRIALWTYARNHGDHFPAAEARSAIPEEAWRMPDASGMHYRYVPGLVPDVGHAVLAYEPALFGERRMVLRTDGQIVLMSPDELLGTGSGGPNP